MNDRHPYLIAFWQGRDSYEWFATHASVLAVVILSNRHWAWILHQWINLTKLSIQQADLDNSSKWCNMFFHVHIPDSKDRGIHYSDVIMGVMASLITSLMSVYSTVHSCSDQRKHQSSGSLAFVRGIHRRPVNSPHKRPVMRKMFPFDDVIMQCWLDIDLTCRCWINI